MKAINIKDIFAFTSHIRIYNICPKLYKLQKKYEFVLPMKKGMIFGTLVHETLEDINKKIFRKENISKNIIKEIFIENYKNIYKKYKMNIDKEVLISGEKSIEEYVKNYPEITENIKDVEVKLSFIKEKYILEGIIDLILEKDGVLEIVDFKTGKKGAEEEGYINQLEIYAYLLKEKYGKEVRKGKLYYLGENKENRITEVYFTKERLSQAVKDFDETAEKIINKDFQ
ncbi:MAG: PD-(D/E)XK nuclease family protein, partial [Fusobacterium sp.]